MKRWCGILAALALPYAVNAQDIVPLAGGGGGDGGPAINATVPVSALAYTPGTLWLASSAQAMVRAVDLGTGRIRAVAGTYRTGRAGEPVSTDPLATSIGNPGPGGLAAGSDGTVYLGRVQRIERIRNGAWSYMIEPGGAIAPTSARGLAASTARLYVADTARLLVYDRACAAQCQPVRVVPGFLSATAVAVSPDDALVYVLDQQDGRVKRVSPDGTLTVIAGGGTDRGPVVPAMSALFGTPQAIALGSDGTVYVTDTVGNRVVGVKDGLAVTVAGTGLAQNGNLWLDAMTALTQPITNPNSLAVSDDWLYVGSTKDAMVYAVERGQVAMPTSTRTAMAVATATSSPIPTVTAMLTSTPTRTATRLPTCRDTPTPEVCAP